MLRAFEDFVLPLNALEREEIIAANLIFFNIQHSPTSPDITAPMFPQSLVRICQIRHRLAAPKPLTHSQSTRPEIVESCQLRSPLYPNKPVTLITIKSGNLTDRKMHIT